MIPESSSPHRSPVERSPSVWAKITARARPTARARRGASNESAKYCVSCDHFSVSEFHDTHGKETFAAVVNHVLASPRAYLLLRSA